MKWPSKRYQQSLGQQGHEATNVPTGLYAADCKLCLVLNCFDGRSRWPPLLNQPAKLMYSHAVQCPWVLSYRRDICPLSPCGRMYLPVRTSVNLIRITEVTAADRLFNGPLALARLSHRTRLGCNVKAVPCFLAYVRGAWQHC